MSVTARARSAARFGVQVQRRVVIVQLLWWPTLLVAGLAIGTATVVAVKRRGSAGAAPESVTAAAPGVHPARDRPHL